MHVLVIGSGAREHALLLALRRDPEVDAVSVAPGNAGTAGVADQYDVDVTSGEDVAALARRIGADLVVVGPEVPLVLGVADTVRAAGIACFGPTRDAARIEGSKSFAKDVMAAAGVRTATSEIVDNPARLDAALDRFGPPGGDRAWVVKDDGLAAGKGVVVTADRDAARAHAAALLEAGHPVLLESFLDGPEVSLFCLVDGETVVPLLPAQDFKRVGDDDTGPNTGGMGAYTPLPWLPADMTDRIVARGRRTRCRRAGPTWQPVLGLALRRPGDHLDGPGRRRIQLPLRRSGDPGRAGAAGFPARSAAARHRHRGTRRSAAAAVARRFGRRRGGRGRELSRPPPGGRRDPRRGRPTACCTRAPPAVTTVLWCRPAAGCCRWSAPDRT